MNQLTQNDLILHHIDATGSISQREALIEYSVQSLTKRISELRKMGYPIRTEFKHNPITGQRYARYFIKRGRK